MCKSCRQLSCDERCQIKALMSRGDSIRKIVDQLGRSPATISREIAHNRGDRGYRHRRAQPAAMRLRSFPAS
ncbi:MAG: helix-turn-helix domain-containing protein [Gammaproteobacteria bacterium]|nr:helix-turn-helix domain-containing protein [Gammaproteobacteria bacterium]